MSPGPSLFPGKTGKGLDLLSSSMQARALPFVSAVIIIPGSPGFLKNKFCYFYLRYFTSFP
jgi:hypothetical protein